MVCFVCGTNLFGQWPGKDLVLKEFCPIKFPNLKTYPKVQHITWAYNIFYVDHKHYISGAWKEKESQFDKIPLPDNFTNHATIMTGNDYNLMFICSSSNKMWVMDLKMEKALKKLKFTTEGPYDETVRKKIKKEATISKAATMNDSFLYLTPENNVYSGVLPSYVDTRHCKGEVCDIQCGYEHYLLLTNHGAVYTWGNGRRLQLGHGDISNIELPTEVEALAGIKIIKISAGGWHSLALSASGDLYAWGWNDVGQLGINETTQEHQSYSLPTLIDLFDENLGETHLNILEIACGSKHSAIILEDYTVWTSGCNKYGQLGLSIDKFPSTSYFRKVFHCDNGSSLMCGPWTTVIVSDDK